MAKFIKLKLETNKEVVLVNTGKIVDVMSSKNGGSLINFGGDEFFSVDESISELEWLLLGDTE